MSKLEYKIIGDKYPVLVMDNFYNEKEYKQIWHELDGYNLNTCLWQTNLEDSERAKDSKGNSLATNSRIYLDRMFNNSFRQVSFILSNYVKLMSEPVLDVYKKMSPPTRNITSVNTDYSMISYYDNNEKYDFHKDRATHSALWWTYKEPKSFNGGDLIFKDGGFDIECINNRMIMFPSFYYHASSPVKIVKNKKDKLGKYTISHFFNINI